MRWPTLDALAPFLMRLCNSRSADVILDSLTPFPTRRYLSGTFLQNILETTSHRYVDLETAILIDSDIDSKAYSFNHHVREIPPTLTDPVLLRWTDAMFKRGR